MKVVFMGTPDFAVPTLLSLSKEHNVLAAVCQPDKPNVRGKKVVYGAVKQEAIKNEIPVLQPQTVRDDDFIKKIAELKPDVIVVAAYGQILSKELLRLPKFGCINVHASLLPKYRGAAPIQWSIINGDDQTGVTIMHMCEKLDAGDMITKSHISIEVTDTYGTLTEKLAKMGAKALIKALYQLETGAAKTIMQNDAEATYAPIINKETGHIKWSSSGKDIVNLIRGLNPAPGAYSEFDGHKMKVWGAKVFGKADESSDYGRVINVLKKSGIIVNAKNESVMITEVQVSGGKKMSAADFLRGRDVYIGMMLI